MRARLAALHASRRGEAAPAGSSSADDNAFLSELADQKMHDWFSRQAPSAAAAEVLANQLVALLRDSAGRPVLRAEAALATLLACYFSPKALERIALRCPLVLPTLASVVASGAQSGQYRSNALEVLSTAARRWKLAGPMIDLQPPLVPLLLQQLRGPLTFAEPAAATLEAIASDHGEGLEEVESWGALHALVDVAAAAAAAAATATATATRGAEPMQRITMALGSLHDIVAYSRDGAPELCERIAAAGAIPQIAAALAHPQAASDEEAPARMVEAALRLAFSLAFASRERAEWLACAGVLRPLVRLGLRHPSEEVISTAAKTIGRIAESLQPGRNTSDAASPPAPHAVVRRLMGYGVLSALAAALRRPIRRAPAYNGSGQGPPAVAAALALAHLSALPQMAAAIVAEPGVLAALLAVLAGAADGGDWALRAARHASTVCALEQSEEEVVPLAQALIKAGAVPILLRLLRLPRPRDEDGENGAAARRMDEGESALDTHRNLRGCASRALFRMSGAGLLAPEEQDELLNAVQELNGRLRRERQVTISEL
jgi:hypothetical protein